MAANATSGATHINRLQAMCPLRRGELCTFCMFPFLSPFCSELYGISRDNLCQDYFEKEQGCYTAVMADPAKVNVGRGEFAPRPLEEHMGWLMSRAAHSLGAALTESLAPLGLNLRDYAVLIAAERAVGTGEPRTQLALSRAARLDKSTMVVALDSLERKGLVERKPDPGDRRARIVEPTDAGRELLARAEEMVADVEDRVLAALDAEERRVLRDLLRRLVTGGVPPDDGAGPCP